MRRSHSDSLSLAHQLAIPTYGIVSRHLLRTHGIDRHRLRRLNTQGELRAHGSHAIHVASASWDPERSPIVAAVMNSGATAWADGAAALVLAGLTGHALEDIDVGVPENAATRQVSGVRRHRFRRPPRLRPSPVSHAEPAHAALHAAAWSTSDTAAACLLEACTAQHIVTVQQLRSSLELLPTLHRRGFVREVLTNLDRLRPPLHEIDIGRMCRQRGIPEPDRTDFTSDLSAGMNLEARWGNAQVTLRIDAHPCALREGTGGDAVAGPSLAAADDTVIHTCIGTLQGHPRTVFERLRNLVTPDASESEGR